MRKTHVNPRILFLVVVMTIALSACTSRQEADVAAEPSNPTSSETMTPESNSSTDIFFYDPSDCLSPGSDTESDPYCNPTVPDWSCDVHEATVEDGYDQLVVGENANASLTRIPSPAPTTISLWVLAIDSLLDDMPSVYITLEEMPGNEFGFAYDTPRLEWIDGTVSYLRMVGITTPDHEPDEPTVYSMEFVDEDGGELYVSVTFDCWR